MPPKHSCCSADFQHCDTLLASYRTTELEFPKTAAETAGETAGEPRGAGGSAGGTAAETVGRTDLALRSGETEVSAAVPPALPPGTPSFPDGFPGGFPGSLRSSFGNFQLGGPVAGQGSVAVPALPLASYLTHCLLQLPGGRCEEPRDPPQHSGSKKRCFW